MSLGKIIKKFRDLRRITQKALGERSGLDDVRIRQYELDIRTPKEDILEKISSALHVNKEYLKEPSYPYDENDLMRFLFKLDDSIEVNIRPIEVADDGDFQINGVYFGGTGILKIHQMLEKWQEMKKEYADGKITQEALEDWKANFPESMKKDYVPKEESNVKSFSTGIHVKVNPDIK